MTAGVRQPYLLGIALVFLATIGWSLAGMFVRFLPGLDGWQINTWRGFSMSVFLLVYLTLAYPRGLEARFREIPASAMIACAAFFAVGSTLYVTSLTLTSTANVSSIAASAPLFTAVLGRLVMDERPPLAIWVAAFLALAGVAYIVRDGLASGDWAGSMIALLVAFCFAGQTVTLRRYSSIDMVPAVCVGGIATFLFAGMFGGGFSVEPRAIAILAVMGLLQLALPLILFARGARYVPAVTLSLVALLDAVLNPFWSWAGAGEVPSLDAALGGTIILGAVAMSIVAGRRMAGEAFSQPPASRGRR